MDILTDKSKKGFTLTETVIALGIVSILLTSFLAVFGPATRNVRKAITTQESGRIVSSLESFFKNGFNNERITTGDTPFKQAVRVLEASQRGVDGEGKFTGTVSGGVLFYNYRIALNNAQSEADSARDTDLRAGFDYTTIPAVRGLQALSNPEVRRELEAIEGRLFYVRFQQLETVRENGNVVLKPVQGGSVKGQKEGDEFLESSFHVRAEFFVIPTVDENYLDRLASGTGTFDFGSALLTRNLTINRF